MELPLSDTSVGFEVLLHFADFLGTIFKNTSKIRIFLRWQKTKSQDNSKTITPQLEVTGANIFIFSVGIRDTLYSGVQEKQQSGVEYMQQLHGLEGSPGA